MRAFRFSLERLLRLRTQRARIARRELAVAMAEVGRIGTRLAALEGSLQACRGEISADVPITGLARAMESGLLYNLTRIRIELVKAEERAELSRATYRERQTDLMALQRLREHRYSTWRVETERESQAEMDEMGRVRHVNLRREGVEE